MSAARLPDNEAERLEQLISEGLLDTPPEVGFDDLVLIASTMFDMPIVALSLVDRERQWFKAKVGLEVDQTPRDAAFCAHAILEPESPLVVEDARNDGRFANNPLVTGAPGIRAYVGVPVRAGNCHLPIGTLCVIDVRPRQVSPAQVRALQALARRAEGLFIERKQRGELAAQLKEREAQRLALSISEGYHRAIHGVIEEGLVVQDASGRIVSANDAAGTILGLSAEQIEGRSSLDPRWCTIHRDGSTFPGEQHPGMVVLATGKAQRNVVMGVQCPDRSLRWISINAQPLMIPGLDADLRNGVVCTFTDISSHVASEAVMRAARDGALDSARAKSAFLANMSHEIRTPLNGLCGMAELLRHEGLSPVQTELADTIMACADTLLHLINDILDFSKNEAGGLILEAVPCSPRQLVADVVAMAHATVREKQLALRIDIAPSVPAQVVGDPVRIRQILLNLVSNALKFTCVGSITIQAECSPIAASEQLELAISVIDSGIGFGPEVAATLFQPFVQADATTTRRFGGTGLGLAICRQLCAKMQGSICCSSQPGSGSTFRFTIRVERASSEPAIVPRAGAASNQLLGRALIAEDNVVNQRVAAALCSRLGLSVTVVSTGNAALEAMDAGGFDVVLMDCQMPEIDGLTAARIWRQREQERAVATPLPILALTANAMGEDRHSCLEAGMNEHLAKPIRLEVLAAALARWLPAAAL